MEFSVLTVGLPLALAALARRLNTLDGKGSLLGFLFGVVVASRGIEWFFLLSFFFLASLLATGFGSEYKKKLQLPEMNPLRRAENVFHNGLAPFLCALSGNALAFSSALAAATADTLSSEIGVGSGEEPRLITRFSEKVKPGTDGGVTKTGTLAGVLGGASFSLLAFYAQLLTPLQTLACFSVSLFGFLFDSFLGATLQKEKKLSNSQVNLVSISAAALLGLAASSAL